MDKNSPASVLLPKFERGLLRDEGEARDIFLKYGLPQKHSPCAEGWKYTPLNSLADRQLRLATDSASAKAGGTGGAEGAERLLADTLANSLANSLAKSASASLASELACFAESVTLLFIDGCLQDCYLQNSCLQNDHEGLQLTPYADLAPVDALEPMAALNLASRCESWKLVLAGEHPLVHIVSLASNDKLAGQDSASSKTTNSKTTNSKTTNSKTTSSKTVSSDTSLRLLQTRLRVEVASGSKAVIFQSSLQGAANCCTNDFLEIEVGEKASLEHVVLHSSSATSHCFTRTVVRLGSSAHYRHISSLRTSGVLRQGISVCLSGTASSCALHGGYRPKGCGHIDNSTEIVHAQADCVSDALYKGAIDDSGSGVFHGKIHVAQDAQGTRGYQMSRALLLSDKARAYHKPELEIYADDVKCSHGATIGSLDEEQMFYLRSRGIDVVSCERLLLEAFLCEALTCEREDCATALREHILS